MAVKMINADTLRAALGADESSAVRVASIHAAVCARVKRYAKNAPTEVKNEAAILMAGWLWQATAQARKVIPEEGAPINASRAFLLSGAQGLLSSWRTPRAGACL